MNKLRVINDARILEFFPPFLFMGVRVLEVSNDYRRLHIKLPIRWYGVNMHGTIFGGFMSAVSDPLIALLCERIFPSTECWTKLHTIEFLRPARTAIDLRIEITQADVDAIRKLLDEKGHATYEFNFGFVDARKRAIAKISSTVFVRRKASPKSALET